MGSSALACSLVIIAYIASTYAQIAGIYSSNGTSAGGYALGNGTSRAVSDRVSCPSQPLERATLLPSTHPGNLYVYDSRLPRVIRPSNNGDATNEIGALQIVSQSPVFRADLYLPCGDNCSSALPDAASFFSMRSPDA